MKRTRVLDKQFLRQTGENVPSWRANINNCRSEGSREKQVRDNEPTPRPPRKPKDGDKPPHKAPRPTNVTVTLYVGPHGKAQSVGFSSPTAEIGDDWAACALKAAATWRLPDPRGQIAKLAIRYKPSQTEQAER